MLTVEAIICVQPITIIQGKRISFINVNYYKRELSRIFNLCYDRRFNMPINKNEITKEQIEKAMQCKSADELMAYAKSEGVDITREEAEAYLAELSEFELKNGELKRVAGGFCGNDLECLTFCKGYSAPYGL